MSMYRHNAKFIRTGLVVAFLLAPLSAHASILGEESFILASIRFAIYEWRTQFSLAMAKANLVAGRTAASVEQMARLAPAPTRPGFDAQDGIFAPSGTFGAAAEGLVGSAGGILEGATGQSFPLQQVKGGLTNLWHKRHDRHSSSSSNETLHTDHDGIMAQLDKQRLYAQANGQSLLRKLNGRGLNSLEAQAYQARSGAVMASATVQAANTLENLRHAEEQEAQRRQAAGRRAACGLAAEVKHMGVLKRPAGGTGAPAAGLPTAFQVRHVRH